LLLYARSFDGEINVLYDGKALGWEKYVDGPEPIPLDDEKSVHERVDNARFDLRSKYYVKPKADHPWLTRRTQSHQQVKPLKLPKRSLIPIKWIETKIDSVECISIHRIDSYVAFLVFIFGWFVTVFNGDMPETRSGRLSGARNAALW
jgi:hypothetical protein